jgi:hypothetical protein
MMPRFFGLDHLLIKNTAVKPSSVDQRLKRDLSNPPWSRAGRLRVVKLGRKMLILRSDAEVWAASLPELRTVGREQASA